MNIPWYRKSIYIIIAPFFIVVWCIMNPKLVWAEFKKEWNIK